MIFVYGANEAWRHGLGAARRARVAYGAKNGIGPFCGNSYGIPTKDKNLNVLDLGRINLYIEKFKEFAKSFPRETFYVTKVGTGLSGYSSKNIAPLFKDAPTNCIFHEDWKQFLGNNYKYFREAL